MYVCMYVCMYAEGYLNYQRFCLFHTNVYFH